jgi:hypothetical protein
LTGITENWWATLSKWHKGASRPGSHHDRA